MKFIQIQSTKRDIKKVLGYALRTNYISWGKEKGLRYFQNKYGEDFRLYFSRMEGFCSIPCHFMRFIEIDGVPAGCVTSVALSSLTAHINIIYLKSRYRGRGYFSAIECEIVKHYQKHGLKKLTLYVSKTNLPALRAYKNWQADESDCDNDTIKLKKDI